MGVADWNPYSTAVKGLEFFAPNDGGIVLDAASKVACMSIKNTVGGNIDKFVFRVGAIPTRGGVYAVEIYDNEDAVPVNPQTLTAFPTADGAMSPAGAWTGNVASPPTVYTFPNVWQTIDEPALSTNDSINTAVLGAAYYYGRMGTAGLALAGKRILGVRLVAYLAVSATPTVFDLGIGEGVIAYKGWTGTISSQSPTRVESFWTNDPATGAPWTIAAVQAFTTTSSWYVAAHPTVVQANACYWAYMEVVIADENRLAVGVINDATSPLTADDWNGYNTATLTTPTGGTWTKDAAGYHLITVRRTSANGSLVLPSLTAATLPTVAHGYTPHFSAAQGYITSMGDPHSTLFAAGFREVGGVYSLDGQPYATIGWGNVRSGTAFNYAAQEFSNAAATGYGFVQALVRPGSAASAVLTLKVKRRSDNNHMGPQTLTWSKAEVDALPDQGNGWKRITGTMAAPITLAAATQYYFLFESTCTGTGNDKWQVLVYDGGFNHPPGPNGALDRTGFGGIIDTATLEGNGSLTGGQAITKWDIPVTIATPPAQVANLTATIDTQEQPEWVDVNCDGCAILTFEFVHLTWTPTSYAALFARYEVQRSEDAGTSWHEIGNIAVEGTTTFDDYETRRGGVIPQYRVRASRLDGALSVWSATAAPARACAAVDCEYAFVTNANPALNCIYNREGGGMEYTFLDAGETVFQRIYERDYQVAFHPTERRGEQFSIPLILNLKHIPTTTHEGSEMFEAIRALSVADVPYVCVLDHLGNRWYADLGVPTGQQLNPARLYVANITVTEVQDTPTSVTVI